MSGILPFGETALASREGRYLEKVVSRIDGAARIRLARVDAEAEVMASKVNAVTYVGKTAMLDAALLSQLEQTLAQTVPMASGRLATIGDVTALAMSGIIADTAHRLHRI